MAAKEGQADIEYSEKYSDAHYEYRHVILPKEFLKQMPNPPRLLSEAEWRGLGVQQSRGWGHYECHKPEPHILLFRRPLGTDPETGLVKKAAPVAAPVAAPLRPIDPNERKAPAKVVGKV